MDNKKKITLGVIIISILLLFYSCSKGFGLFGNKEVLDNKNTEVVTENSKNTETKREENKEDKKEEIKEKDTKEKNSKDALVKENTISGNGSYTGKLHPDYFKNNNYTSTYCPIKNVIDKKVEENKLNPIKDNKENVVEKVPSDVPTVELPTAEIEKVPNDAPTVDLPIAEIEKVPNDAPTVELPTAEIEKAPSDAPTVELPIAEIEKVPNYAPTIELEVYDDYYEKRLSLYEKRMDLINDGDYSDKSFENFKNILEQAKKYKYLAVVSKEEKDRMLVEVEKAFNGLVVDKSELNAEILKAENVDENLYSKESYDELKKVLDEANKLKENTNATQREVDELTAKLKDALSKLTTNKEKLIAKIKEAESKKETDYSKDSYATLKTALTKAKEVKENINSTQTEIDNAEKELQNAINGLVVDKTELKNTIKLADEIVKDREIYTEESYNDFFAIFENAKTIDGLSSTTQREVDEIVEELKEVIKDLVKKPKSKPELTIVELVENQKEKSAVLNYNLVDSDKTYIGAKAKLYKGDKLVTELDINENTVTFNNLEYNVEYRVETELKYNVDDAEKSEILEDKRTFTLEDEVKKVEIKNIENVSVLKKDGENFVAISNLTSIPSDLENYFVKIKSSTMIDSLFKVSKIEESNGKFKVVATAPQLVQYNNVNRDYDNDFTVLVDKKSQEQGVYTSFKDLVEAIKQNPSGNFVLAADVSADEITLSSGETSYIPDTFTGTLIAEKDGKIFSISGLKAPLFNNLESSTIEKINLIDVNINSNVENVGALAKTTNANNENAGVVTISNVNVEGNISAPYNIGGIVVAAKNTNIENVTFTGNINMIKATKPSYTGGIVATIDGGNISKVSVIADINVITIDPYNKAGMIVGFIPNGKITNVYAKGNLLSDKNTGQVGAFVGSTWRNGQITKAISEVDVINGLKIHGDKGATNNTNSIGANIYILENKLGEDNNKHGNKLGEIVNKAKIDELIVEYSIPKFVKENKFSNTSVDYSQLDEYSADKNNVYKNMEKIIPLYNRDYILKQGNKVSSTSNLYSKKILSVVPMIDNKIITDILENKENINKLMVHYSDNTVEYFNLSYKEDFENVIAEYTIGDTDLIYTPNQYITDYSSLVNSVKDEFKNIEYFSDEVYNVLNYVPTNPNKSDERDVVLEKLYLKYSFKNVKENIESILKSIISNSSVFGSDNGSNNEYIKKYLVENKVNILLGLSYLQKWYNIDFGTINIKDLVLFRQDFFGKNINELEWIINVGKLGFNSLNPTNNFTTYPTLLSSNTGEGNLFSYLEKNKEIFEPDKTVNQWFKESTKAYITERASSERPDINVEIYNTLKAEKFRNMLLPLLSLSEENVYIIKNFSTVSFGIFDRYVDMELKNTNPQLFEEKIQELKARIENISDAHKEHFDFWYRISPANTREKLINDVPTWDSNYKFSENNQYSYNHGLWYPAYGETSKSIYEFFGPVGRWHGNLKDNREAYANGSHTWFISLGLLNGNAGNSVFSHEMTHNYDGGIYFGGYGRRMGFGAEAFARGMFEAPRSANTWDFGINSISDFRDNKENSVHNLHPTRFSNDAELQQYMKGIFDVIYTLDYIEAMSLIKKPYDEQALVLRQIKNKDDFTDYSDGVTTEIAQDLNLQNIDDFVDNNIAIRGYYDNKPLGLSNRNTYNVASMFNPFYGILENPNGAPGGHTFKRTAFELLGANGYENGMLPYISNKLKEQAEAEGVSFGDSYILNKVFNGRYQTFAEFKKAQFKNRIDKISKLKTITITFRNQEHLIDSFEKIVELMDIATTKDIELRKNGNYQRANNVTDLKSTIYKEYFKITDEFRTSIYND